MSETPLGEAVPHFGSGRRKTARPAAPSSRRAERGQTILLVAVSMIALIAMAALAIDVTTLYIARSEAEKAADAGALAGAKAFVSTGFTSGGLGVPAASEALACNGSTGFADVQARVAANQNQIAGGPPTTVTTACAFPSPQNPQITVTVNRTNLPTFFSRIWGPAGSQVTVSSKAEAYNPSGLAAPISVASVKPWLVANCDQTGNPGPANPACLNGGAYFITPPSYALANSGNFIGKSITLQQITPAIIPPPLSTYYNLDIDMATPGNAVSCPANTGPSCGAVNPGGPGYFESVACANTIQLQCGPNPANVAMRLFGGVLLPPPTEQATQCLIHADAPGAGQGQDIINPPAIAGSPVTIDGGGNNPEPGLVGRLNISRSDSVVTVPIGDCPLGSLFCPSFNIVGFMQLGIKQVNPAIPVLPPLIQVPGNIEAVILNVSGCGSAAGTPVSGGAISPIPIRLIQ